MSARRRRAISDAEVAFLTGQSTDTDIAVTPSILPLDQIADRVAGDTRPLNPSHVEALAGSIALLGLIEPLAVDSKGRLLAGGHRWAAISLLKESQPEVFEKWFPNGIPVHRLGFDSELQPDLAIQVEVTENEQRRDYTPAEVRAIADRFREAGYGVKGRPGKGQSPLIPALMSVVGKSRATVKRYLAGGESGSDEPLSEPDYDRMLQQVSRVLSQWREKPRKTKAEKELEKDLARTLDAIAAHLEKSRR